MGRGDHSVFRNGRINQVSVPAGFGFGDSWYRFAEDSPFPGIEILETWQAGSKGGLGKISWGSYTPFLRFSGIDFYVSVSPARLCTFSLSVSVSLSPSLREDLCTYSAHVRVDDVRCDLDKVPSSTNSMKFSFNYSSKKIHRSEFDKKHFDWHKISKKSSIYFTVFQKNSLTTLLPINY